MTKICITLFKADWCGYCKRFVPDWNKIKSILQDGEIKNKLDDEQIEVIFDQFEETKGEDRETIIQNNISSYPTIKVSIFDKNNKKLETFELESEDRELNRFVETALKSLPDQIKNLIKKEINKTNNQNNPNMKGGYFNYVKPDIKYYHKYLKYKSKYLSLKNKL